MTPDVTGARAQRAAELGYAVLVVQLRGGGLGRGAISDDVQTDHLAAAAQHGYHPKAMASTFDETCEHFVTYLLERVPPAESP